MPSSPHPSSPDASPPPSAADAIRSLEAFDRLVAEQAGLIDRLDALSLEQAEAVEREDGPLVIDVLARREPIIRRMGQIAGELAPLREVMRGDAHPRARVLSERLERLGRSLDAIMERDEADRAALEHARTRIGDELAGMFRSRTAMKAYGAGPARHGPIFQDREG